MSPVPLLDGVSVVVPVYNSEASLPLLIERLHPVLRSQSAAFETILVDDGSRDSSWTVIQSLAREHSFVRGIRLMRNYGQHNALLCGIRAACYSTIVTMDDDLQNPPEEIPRLLAKIGEGFDVVYGTPLKESHGLFRDVASRITKLVLQKSMGAETAANVSAFRAFRTRLREASADYRGAFVSIDVLLTWGGRRFTAIRVKNERRTIGVSNYTIWKLFVHTMNMMTGFSTIPLQVSSMLGLLLTAFGFVILVYVIGGYAIRGSPVQGFTFLASLLAVFSGAQLFALGVMGEYLARIHVRSMDRPSFAVECTTAEERRQ